MSYNVSAADARTISTSDSVIYNEVDAITREVIAASLLGELDVSIDDGTTMTESTPTITVTGTVSDPVVGGLGEALDLASESVSLAANSDLDQIVAAINDASIAGLTASKNTSNQLVLTYEPPQAAWSFTIGVESGNATVGLTDGTTTATDPESVQYYNVWTGTSSDRKKSFEYSQVVNHFQNLGYNILAKQNTATGNTFLWEVYW